MRARLTRLLLLFGLARGAARARNEPGEHDDGIDPRRRDVPASPGNELLVAVLLAVGGLLLVAFGVLVAVEASTQLLGGLLGAGLAALAAALIVAGKGVVVQETSVQERISGDSPEAVQRTEDELASGIEGVSRRRLLLGAAGVTGTGALVAAAVPFTAIGPSPEALLGSPWRAGTALVDEQHAAIRADELEVGSFLTAFPRGADMRELGSPVVVVRADPAELRLPAGRAEWAPEGIMAFSKICTHAGCAVSLYRYPVDERLSSGPALVCPCHYSTFDVRRGARVIFGPAGRPLPQLPLRIAADNTLVAGGPLSGSVGPAWWGTRRGRT